MPCPTVLFLKAQIKGGAAGDLFAAPITVAPHVRAGKIVAGYTAVRHKAPAEAPVMTLEQFAKKHRMVTTADVDGHLHAGLRSKPQTKTYDRWFNAKLTELQAARDATMTAYQAAVQRGEIRTPESLSRREKLEISAAGHPDNEATQAARRLLAKMDAHEATAKAPPSMPAITPAAEQRADLPEGGILVQGNRQLTTGKWRVQHAETGASMSNWQPSADEAVREARQRVSNAAAAAEAKAQRQTREQEIADRLLAGGEPTERDLELLGLKRQARFDYLSPVVQRIFGISSRKVRAAMGDTLRRAVNGMNTAEHWVADSRRALMAAAAYAKARAGTPVRPFPRAGGRP